METFEEWWSRTGRSIDPDTSDVPWYDKRKGLAEAAFNAARAQSANYTVDDSVYPRQVLFGNGRVVICRESDEDNGHHFLGIGRRDGEFTLDPEKTK